MTKRIAAGARMLKINFLDHVIVGQPIAGLLGYFSFHEAGLLRRQNKKTKPMVEPFTLSSEPPPAKLQRLIPEPVELLIEHPLADRKWVVAKELAEPRWFLLCTTDGQTLALHESQFRIVE